MIPRCLIRNRTTATSTAPIPMSFTLYNNIQPSSSRQMSTVRIGADSWTAQARLIMKSIRPRRIGPSPQPAAYPPSNLPRHDLRLSYILMDSPRIPCSVTDRLCGSHKRHDHKSWTACGWRWKSLPSLLGKLERSGTLVVCRSTTKDALKRIG